MESSEYLNPSNLISPYLVAQAVYNGIRYASTNLRSDVLAFMEEALTESEKTDPESREASVLSSILENAEIGAVTHAPICQDTGSVWICLEVGYDALVPGNVMCGVPDAVASAYEDGRLRMSMVQDALFDRTNTKTNNPAFFDIKFSEEEQTKLHVLLKGGGSDNASRLIMLAPGDGIDRIKEEVVACVKEKAANACPPLIVGVGVGGTFDKVAGLSKMALLRKVGTPAENNEAATLESELLSAINELGIGAGALGGNNTAIAVHVNTAPSHIAALPLAINMGCSAMRSATFALSDEQGIMLNEPVRLD